MKKFTYTIQDSMGIHARPAGLFVKVAAKDSKTQRSRSAKNGKKLTLRESWQS